MSYMTILGGNMYDAREIALDESAPRKIACLGMSRATIRVLPRTIFAAN